MRRAAFEADGRGVDGFLSKRAEALALKCLVAPPNLTAHEELLEAVVHGARQHHAAQDLETLVLGQRRRNRRAAEEPVAGVGELCPRLLHALDGRSAGRGVIGALGRLQRLVEAARQLAAERRAEPVERRVVARFELRAADCVEDVEHERHREGMALGDEGAQPAGEAGELVGVGGGARHDPLLCSGNRPCPGMKRAFSAMQWTRTIGPGRPCTSPTDRQRSWRDRIESRPPLTVARVMASALLSSAARKLPSSWRYPW